MKNGLITSYLRRCTGTGESALKKAKAVPFARKVVVIAFWHKLEIIFIDYLQKKHDYCANLLQRLTNEIKKKTVALCQKESAV